MANLRDIKRRIVSVRNTQKITRAMKMVSASKLRRAQDAILQARPYAYHLRDLVNRVAARAGDATHPLLRSGQNGKVGIIVVTSDRGLCGGFNSNIVNKTIAAAAERFKNREVELTVVGRKGIEALRRQQLPIRATYTDAGGDAIPHSSERIVHDLVEQFTRADIDELHCVYNEFKSAVQQDVVLEQLLPLSTDADSASEKPLDYLYEPSQAVVFEQLLVRNIEVQMRRILHESAASEFGARMTAMDAATRNAGDVIKRLTLQYNRARQDAITTQLIEVISGAEAL